MIMNEHSNPNGASADLGIPANAGKILDTNHPFRDPEMRVFGPLQNA